MSIWTPGQSDVARQHRRELMEQAYTDAQLNFWTRELKQIDPYLQMVRAKGNSELLKPGFFYVLRHNPAGPPSVMCVEGPDGEFMEPTSQIFDQLRRDDMWNAEANRDRARMQQDAEKARQRRKDAETSDRRLEFVERIQSAFRTSVSMNRSRPWTQNQHGRKG